MTVRKAGSEQADVKPVKLLKSGVPSSVGKRTQFKKGKSGNPAGLPKGTIHLSTRIQNMMNDENFEMYLPDTREGWKAFKGAPAEAIIRTAMIKAAAGDTRSADWLAKYGWGNKIELTGADGVPLMPIALDATILNRYALGGSSPSIPATDSSK